MLLARLSVLAGLDMGYTLAYPGRLAMRASETAARVATGVTLQRYLSGAPGGTGADGGRA